MLTVGGIPAALVMVGPMGVAALILGPPILMVLGSPAPAMMAEGSPTPLLIAGGIPPAPGRPIPVAMVTVGGFGPVVTVVGPVLERARLLPTTIPGGFPVPELATGPPVPIVAVTAPVRACPFTTDVGVVPFTGPVRLEGGGSRGTTVATLGPGAVTIG